MTKMRQMQAANNRHQNNINKRGLVPPTLKEKSNLPVDPMLVGFFVFVVVGSVMFQLINSALTGTPQG
eukprot:m.332041 g.332041  ORF g.332041 m.332041 type:complete len:68 (+) comp16862_c0_seq1:128-331(+)